MGGLNIELGVKSLRKMAQLLDVFTVERPDRPLGEIASACGLHPSTARRLLATCEAVGFIAQDPITRRYRLGMKLFELGHRVGEQIELRHVARPYLEEIVARTHESAYLSLLVDEDVLYIDRVVSSQAVQLTSFVGQRLPPHTTGTGKVHLAYLPPERLDLILSGPLTRFTSKTICDPDELRRDLEMIRVRGFSTTLDEHLEGAFSVAAPIFGPGGLLLAGVGISGPSYRVSAEQIADFAKVITEVARSFSLKMGARVAHLSN